MLCCIFLSCQLCGLLSNRNTSFTGSHICSLILWLNFVLNKCSNGSSKRLIEVQVKHRWHLFDGSEKSRGANLGANPMCLFTQRSKTSYLTLSLSCLSVQNLLSLPPRAGQSLIFFKNFSLMQSMFSYQTHVSHCFQVWPEAQTNQLNIFDNSHALASWLKFQYFIENLDLSVSRPHFF